MANGNRKLETAEPRPEDEARIIAVDRKAFTSFAEGRFEETCECYTPDAQRQITALLGASDCVHAWRKLDARFRALSTPEEYRLLTTRSIASVEVKGTSAEARYAELPASLRNFPGVAGTVTMRKIDGDWKIDQVPSAKSDWISRLRRLRALLARRRVDHRL